MEILATDPLDLTRKVVQLMRERDDNACMLFDTLMSALSPEQRASTAVQAALDNWVARNAELVLEVVLGSQ